MQDHSSRALVVSPAVQQRTAGDATDTDLPPVNLEPIPACDTVVDQLIELESLRVERSIARIRDLQALAVVPRTGRLLADHAATGQPQLPARRSSALPAGNLVTTAVASAVGAATALILHLSVFTSQPMPAATGGSANIVLPEAVEPVRKVVAPVQGDGLGKDSPQALPAPVLPAPPESAEPASATRLQPRIPWSYLRAAESGVVERWTEDGIEKFVLASKVSAESDRNCRTFLVWESGGDQGTAINQRACTSAGQDFRDARLEPGPTP